MHKTHIQRSLFSIQGDKLRRGSPWFCLNIDYGEGKNFQLVESSQRVAEAGVTLIIISRLIHA